MNYMVPRVFLRLTLNLATIKPKYSPEDAQKIDFQRDKGRNGYIVMPSSLTDALATTFQYLTNALTYKGYSHFSMMTSWILVLVWRIVSKKLTEVIIVMSPN